MNDRGDCRTAPATPGLLISLVNFVDGHIIVRSNKLVRRLLSKPSTFKSNLFN